MGIPSMVVKNKAISSYFADQDVFYFNNSIPGGLNNVLLKLIDNPELLLQKRERLSEIRSNYLWSNEAKKYNEIIKRMIKG